MRKFRCSRIIITETPSCAGAVALVDGAGQADQSGDVVALIFCVRWLPLPAGGDLPRGPLASALRPVLPRRCGSCWPSVASPLTTSLSTGGCSASPLSSLRAPGQIRPTSRSPAGRRTCTGRLTSMARPLTSCYSSGATWRRPGGSSPGRYALARSGRGRHRAHPTIGGSLMSWSPRPCTRCSGRRTTPLRLITGGRRHGCGRCEASNVTGQQGSWPRVTRSMPNLRRGHYDIATGVPVHHKLPTIFDGLAPVI